MPWKHVMHYDCNIILCIKYNCDNNGNAKFEEHSTNSGVRVVLVVDWSCRSPILVIKTHAAAQIPTVGLFFGGKLHANYYCQPRYFCIPAKHMHLSYFAFCLFRQNTTVNAFYGYWFLADSFVSFSLMYWTVVTPFIDVPHAPSCWLTYKCFSLRSESVEDVMTRMAEGS